MKNWIAALLLFGMACGATRAQAEETELLDATAGATFSSGGYAPLPGVGGTGPAADPGSDNGTGEAATRPGDSSPGMGATTATTGAGFPTPADLITPDGLPMVGKWMYAPSGQPARWLGQLIVGKKLQEPINVILVDNLSNSPEEAKQRLLTACTEAGYPSRFGHSTGYRGYIGEMFYDQLPEGKRAAFSDRPFEIANNHGRIFGPALIDNRYYFTGAFSRESVDPFSKPKHRYVSFNQARDAFAARLQEKTQFKLTGHAALKNDVLQDPDITTGDHDGIAVVLTLSR